MPPMTVRFDPTYIFLISVLYYNSDQYYFIFPQTLAVSDGGELCINNGF